MFLLVLLGLSMVSVVAAGGHLSALSSAHFRHTWTVLVGLTLQILIISIIPFSDPSLLAAIHLLSYVFIGIFVYANRSKPGLWILGAGWGCNLIAIAANGGVMPTASFAVASSARAVAANEFVNSRALPHPRLQFLGDIFAIPRSWPLHNVFSIGDVLIVIGAFVLLHSLCHSRLAPYLGSRDAAALRARESASG